MSKVRFQPYVGERFNDSCYGIRLLVLGESHYHDDANPNSSFTYDVVQQNAFQAGNAFFTKVTKLLRGNDAALSEEDRIETWKHVAFYNYIQEIVGNAPRIPPTKEMWKAANEPFVEVVSRLKPDVILVLGIKLWSQIPDLPPEHPVEWAGITHPCGSMIYQLSFSEIARAINTAGGTYP